MPPRRYTVRTKSPQLSKHVSFSYAPSLPAVWLAWPWGQLLTLLPLHFLLGLPAASPLFSTAPWKGWVKQVLPAVSTTDSSFLPLAVTVSPGFHGTKEPSQRGDHNGLAAHLAEPSLINTQPPCCRFNQQLARGRMGGLCATRTKITWLQMGCATAAVTLTTIEMQLNTQRCF